LKTINTIIFDFGGIILNIDHRLTEKAFAALGVPEFDKLYSQYLQTHLFNGLETGVIQPDEFRDEIRKIAGKDFSDLQIDTAWNAMLLDIPEQRIRLLEQLKPRYRTFLLSNTNIIHYWEYTAGLHKKFGYADFSPLFEKAHFSFELGKRKPHPETFEYVMEKNGIDRQTALFIDDSPQHIQGAMKAGLHTYLHDAKNEICNAFDPVSLNFSPIC
jgi:putative hydrolase of the HAD superfamily